MEQANSTNGRKHKNYGLLPETDEELKEKQILFQALYGRKNYQLQPRVALSLYIIMCVVISGLILLSN